jgi:hypothetical protein
LFGTGYLRNAPYSAHPAPKAKKIFRSYIRGFCRTLDEKKNIIEHDEKTIKVGFELFKEDEVWGKLNRNFPNVWSFARFVDILKNTHDK